MIERWRYCRACEKETNHYRKDRNEGRPGRRADRGLLALPFKMLDLVLGRGEGRWTCWSCLKREADATRKRAWEADKAERKRRREAARKPT